MVDKITLDIDVNDILFEHAPIDATPGVPPEPEPRLDFSDILFKDNKKKHWEAKKIRKKYLRMGSNRDKAKRSAQRATQQLKISKYLETDCTEAVDYNNDIDITDVYDDVSLSSDGETIIYEEPVIKHRNPKRKSDTLQRFYTKKFMKNARDGYDVQYIKQVPVQPRDRLSRATKKAQSDDVEFIKQVPIYPRDSLKGKTRNLKHLRDGIKERERELKIARDNVSALMQGKVSFNPERFLNKTAF